MRPLGLIETARTGVAALARGAETDACPPRFEKQKGPLKALFFSVGALTSPRHSGSDSD